jgi:hypothetical protein
MNDECLSGCFYSSFVIFNPSKLPTPPFSWEDTPIMNLPKLPLHQHFLIL